MLTIFSSKSIKQQLLGRKTYSQSHASPWFDGNSNTILFPYFHQYSIIENNFPTQNIKKLDKQILVPKFHIFHIL